MKLFLLFLFCQISSPVKHYLKFLFTVSSGIQTLPTVVTTAQVDEAVFWYCDSSSTDVEVKQDWMKKIVKDEPQQFDWYSQGCITYEQIFKDQLTTIMRNLNQSGGVHILQRMSGCEWDDDTEEVNAFRLHGHDGEDYIKYDMKAETWIAATPEAVVTKQQWDNNTDNNRYWKNFLTTVCPQWVKKYLDYGKSSLLRTDPPSVSLLQKTPSSAVSCHATGFYPDRALMFWRKDGEEIHEGVEHGEILPNHDGTFQMTVDLNVSSAEDWRRYHCVFQFDGAEDRIITELDRTLIRTNRGKYESRNHEVKSSDLSVTIGVAVVAVVLLTVAAVGFTVYKKKKEKRLKNTPENTELSVRLNAETSDEKHNV